jgi:hypothetical protein
MPRGKQLAEKNTSRKEYSKITTFLGFQTCHFSLLKKMCFGTTIYVLPGNAGVCYSTNRQLLFTGARGRRQLLHLHGTSA